MAKKNINSTTKFRERVDISKNHISMPIENLISVQMDSFNKFIETGIKTVFSEVNPIIDNSGRLWSLEFLDYRLGKPNTTELDAINKDISYDAPLFYNIRLINKQSGEVKEQELFICDLPIMTNRGSFIIGGIERVVVNQIIRSEGVVFMESGELNVDNSHLYLAKLIPERGSWYNFEVNKHGVISVKILAKRPKILITELLRAIGYSSNAEILNLFTSRDANIDDKGSIREFIENTLLKDSTSSKEEAVMDIYRKLRPDISTSYENAKDFIYDIFFNPKRLYLGRTGRYQLTKKLGNNPLISNIDDESSYSLYPTDIIAIIKRLIEVNLGKYPPDDIDSLGNRRIKLVGEHIMDYLRIGVHRVEKNIKDRMSLHGTDELLVPSVLVSTRPITAAFNEFFGSSELSAFMDQVNVLSELVNKRRITTTGPKGLTKERATYSVRDTHFSHYGRICPVETPEGPNIGLVNQLAVYSRVNSYGLLETPYRKVESNVKVGASIHRITAVEYEDIPEGTLITKEVQAKLKALKLDNIEVYPYITDEIEYMESSKEYDKKITSITIDYDKYNNILSKYVPLRYKGTYNYDSISKIEYIECSNNQIAGMSVSLIPFASHNYSQRTLLGTNMQRQAVPLVNFEAPFVGTGFERVIGINSKRIVLAPYDGEVVFADASKVTLKYKNEKGKVLKETFPVQKFYRTNLNTCFTQNIMVKTGDKVTKGQIIIDGPNFVNGEIALGTNIKVAYMLWDGYTYDDGIVISKRLVDEDVLTSIHISKFSQEVRDTRLGAEMITRDVPGNSDYSLRNLDESGIVRVGAYVHEGDLLVGIVAPKGETELTAEERLLRAVFGDYAKDVRDNSLKVPHGVEGVVVNVNILSKESGDKLPTSVIYNVKVEIAQTRKIQVGDKLSGRYGDKGVISKIVPIEDMPYTKDGTPVDIVLSPLGIIKRMNIAQFLELNLGLKAEKLGVNFELPIFTQLDQEKLNDAITKYGGDKKSLNELDSDKVFLSDGKTSEIYPEKVSVGPRYILKLNHMVEDKVHARATGSYTLVTQQPLGGKAQFGGQRFGEMEVWALEAYGASAILQEMLTIKSDDIKGRSDAYKAIITGEKIGVPGKTEGFRVFTSEMRSLGIELNEIYDDTGSTNNVNTNNNNENNNIKSSGENPVDTSDNSEHFGRIA